MMWLIWKDSDNVPLLCFIIRFELSDFLLNVQVRKLRSCQDSQ